MGRAVPSVRRDDRFAVNTKSSFSTAAVRRRRRRDRARAACRRLRFLDGRRDASREGPQRRAGEHQRHRRSQSLHTTAVSPQGSRNRWDEAVPIDGTAALIYLAKRGIDLDDVPDDGGLRWHPRAHGSHGQSPASSPDTPTPSPPSRAGYGDGRSRARTRGRSGRTPVA